MFAKKKETNGEEAPATEKMKFKKIYLIPIAILVLLAAAALGVYLFVQYFLGAETAVRDSWEIDTGEFVAEETDLAVSIYSLDYSSDMMIYQIVPDEYEEEGFTFYDTDVQNRLAAAIVDLYEMNNPDASSPLVIYNPFGTASNSLYVAFSTKVASHITYTISVDDDSIVDYTATAYEDGSNTKNHEFQIIGLVPGMTNTVTMEIVGSWGNSRNTITFTVDMPETQSEYPVQLETTDGESTTELSDGLYVMCRVNGYLGYAFFYDNDGVMRYEMVTEGYGLERIYWTSEGNMMACVSAYKIAEFNRLGQVVATYSLGQYEMHHDYVLLEDQGVILALASDTEDEYNLEDLLVEININTGEVELLLDFKDAFATYYEEDANELTLTDEFFWLAGQKDWIHLNTLQYVEDTDGIIVSSRETSTIIRIDDIHGEQNLVALIGDEDFWADTEYAEYIYTQVGDFVPQYGQHTVDYLADDSLEEGQYYLRLYNNNYWCNGTRDDYEISDLPDSVGTELLSDELTSQMYLYLVDSNAKTFELVKSFDVPYSSIVSSVSNVGDGNYVINSGTSMVWGEYDNDGNLIREFAYICTLQTYRVYKDDFVGYWFQ